MMQFTFVQNQVDDKNLECCRLWTENVITVYIIITKEFLLKFSLEMQNSVDKLIFYTMTVPMIYLIYQYAN